MSRVPEEFYSKALIPPLPAHLRLCEEGLFVVLLLSTALFSYMKSSRRGEAYSLPRKSSCAHPGTGFFRVTFLGILEGNAEGGTCSLRSSQVYANVKAAPQEFC